MATLWGLFDVFKGFTIFLEFLKWSVQNSDTNIAYRFGLGYRTMNDFAVVFLMGLL